ncbi:unnamed protein product [Ixodes persulcatus]
MILIKRIVPYIVLIIFLHLKNVIIVKVSPKEDLFCSLLKVNETGVGCANHKLDATAELSTFSRGENVLEPARSDLPIHLTNRPPPLFTCRKMWHISVFEIKENFKNWQ